MMIVIPSKRIIRKLNLTIIICILDGGSIFCKTINGE